MRAKIIQCLGSNCTIISGTASWYQGYQAPVNTAKPYGVVKLNNKVRSSVNRMGAVKNLEIWPYIDRYDWDFDKVGSAVKEIVDALDETLLTTAAGDTFEVEYDGDGPDYFDEERDAITRVVYFTIPTLK